MLQALGDGQKWQRVPRPWEGGRPSQSPCAGLAGHSPRRGGERVPARGLTWFERRCEAARRAARASRQSYESPVEKLNPQRISHAPFDSTCKSLSR
eukprot:5672909-Amphidinium_carterae.1